jgi:hypothetical protein
MKLQKIYSAKHKGAIFLREYNRRDSFICKVYAIPQAESVADTIIKAFEQEQELEREQKCQM